MAELVRGHWNRMRKKYREALTRIALALAWLALYCMMEEKGLARTSLYSQNLSLRRCVQLTNRIINDVSIICEVSS